MLHTEKITTYTYKSNKKGTNLLILSAIHGNETAGTIACQRIMKELDNHSIKLTSGTLTLVPICNPEAYRQNTRSIDENLNRVITPHSNPQTYEQYLANQICPLIAKNDYTLDLHSTHCPQDEPFAFCDYPDSINQKLLAGLDVKYILQGWPQIYSSNISNIQDYSTEYYAHVCHTHATTLECGYHKSSTSQEIAYQSIRHALNVFGMVSPEKIINKPKKHILMQNYVIKEFSGTLSKTYKHLDKISKGEVIAKYDNQTILSSPNDGYILLPNLGAEIGSEWYYFGIDND